MRGKLVGLPQRPDLAGRGRLPGRRGQAHAGRRPAGDLRAAERARRTSSRRSSRAAPGEISPTEYAGIGDVTEFRYGDVVGNAFRDGNLSNLNNLAGSMLLASGDAVDVHRQPRHPAQRPGPADLQGRSDLRAGPGVHAGLPVRHARADVAASPSPTTRPARRPPANGTTNAVSCGSGWECEHRWRTIGQPGRLPQRGQRHRVTNWWTQRRQPDRVRPRHRRVRRVQPVRLRADAARSARRLPAGTYCDVANGDFSGDHLLRVRPYTVNASGQFTATVPANGDARAAHQRPHHRSSPTPTPTTPDAAAAPRWP